MVGAHYSGLNEGAPEIGDEARIDPNVVDAPADVAGTPLTPSVPVRVGIASFGMERAEGVDPALGEQPVDPGALLREEAGALRRFLRPRNVDLRMGDVEVAHERDVAAGRAQRADVREERLVEG